MEAVIKRISEIINMADDGQIGMMDAVCDLQDMVKPLEEALGFIKEFKKEHVDELAMLKEDYPDGYGGYTFEYRNGAMRLGYKNISEWAEANKELKDIEKKYKAAYLGFQKGIQPVTEDGEILELPEPTYSASSIILKPIKR